MVRNSILIRLGVIAAVAPVVGAMIAGVAQDPPPKGKVQTDPTARTAAALAKDPKVLARLQETRESEVFKEVKAKLPQYKYTIDGQEKTFYLVEEDIQLDEDQLVGYVQARLVVQKRKEEREAQRKKLGLSEEEAERAGLGVPFGPQLSILLPFGSTTPTLWNAGSTLTYCVLRNTFQGPNAQANYQAVVNELQAAGQDWSSVCNIKFSHQSQHDTATIGYPGNPPAGVTFVVREWHGNERWVAYAFFPQDARYMRHIRVRPTWYTVQGVNRKGVLTHELGHALGFAHEFTRSDAPPMECNNFGMLGGPSQYILNSYDPNSVMQYPNCNGFQNYQMKLTDKDRAGAVMAYGSRPGIGPQGETPAVTTRGLPKEAVISVDPQQ